MVKEKKKREIEKVPSAEYYESRRDFLIKLAEARRERNIPKRKVNPLTLCPTK